MRPAGIAAAACLYALDHHVERLAEDHEHARLLAKGLAEIEGVEVRTPVPESNMVFFDPTPLGITNREFLTRLIEYGVKMGGVRGVIRAVLHLDVPRKGVKTALSAAREIAEVVRRKQPRTLQAGAQGV